MDKLARFLEERERQHLLRVLAPLEQRFPARAVRDGVELIDFSSNDYLGLSHHPKVVQAAQDALDNYGMGAGASRLMSGDLAIHHELEETVAEFKGKEAALVFNSGYQANIGIIPALADRHSVIFADQLCHASMLDGALLSRAKLIRFRHNDLVHLEELLRKRRAEFSDALLLTETVFSMDGDLAPLKGLVELKTRYRCLLMVDEAHATGIFGPQGRGRVSDEGLTGEVDLIMGTFSKALGGFGAYLAASSTVVQYLINSARSFIYSTALPPAVIAANLAAVRWCLEQERPGQQLLTLAARFRQALQGKGWQVGGESQIVPVMVGESEPTALLAKELQRHGFLVLPIRPPTVPEGQARLRFSLCSAHTDEQLDQVMQAIVPGI